MLMLPLKAVATLCLFVFSSALAAEPLKGDPTLPSIPTQPSAPPRLDVKPPADIFSCSREFTHQGQRYNCDSLIRQDGERLRPIIKDVPAAVVELDLYQQNRRAVRSAAYLGTLGVMIALLGTLISNAYKDPNGNTLSLYGGLGLTGGTLLYGVSRLHANERHLGNAVNLYNNAHPDRPIELLFTTELNL